MAGIRISSLLYFSVKKSNEGSPPLFKTFLSKNPSLTNFSILSFNNILSIFFIISPAIILAGFTSNIVQILTLTIPSCGKFLDSVQLKLDAP
ncbi:hypothetical protein ES703_63144 [subsurface metagenome]